MNRNEHSMLSDLLADERRAGARTAECELAASWSRECNRARHERGDGSAADPTASSAGYGRTA